MNEFLQLTSVLQKKKTTTKNIQLQIFKSCCLHLLQWMEAKVNSVEKISNDL